MRHVLISLLFCAAPLAAQEVDLELVLLADASGSISSGEIAFQRNGYAEAITHPDVIAAIQSTLTGTIAVTYVEWAEDQRVVVDWTIISGPDEARGFAEALLVPPRLAQGRNAIGAALLEGMRLIEENDITGLRRVIDFSGDSANNWTGPPIEESRDAVVAAGITINALPILHPDDPGRSGRNLESVYAQQIIGGPGAFVVTADDRNSFAAAVRRKLILEISGLEPTPGTSRAAASGSGTITR